MDTNALFKIGYGLYVLTAHEEGKDNGCIVNTVMQVTSDPPQIAVAVNKQNYTCKMIQNTKKFNVSILSEDTQFSTFKHFGYQSGKDINKFLTFLDTKRSPNGILYVTKGTNGFMSAYVKQENDLGSHVLFVAQLVEAECFNNVNTMTYNYYQNNVKPKPEKTAAKGWRCKICGYVYEGEELPADYICPLCKHGASDFEKI